MWKPLTDLSNIPEPPQLEDILPSQNLVEDLDSFSASQALRGSTNKGNGILKSRMGTSAPRKALSDLSNIPEPPQLEDILPSQNLVEDLDSSASQALRCSTNKGTGILKYRTGASTPRSRVRFVPPMQRRDSNEGSQSQTQSQNLSQGQSQSQGQDHSQSHGQVQGQSQDHSQGQTQSQSLSQHDSFFPDTFGSGYNAPLVSAGSGPSTRAERVSNTRPYRVQSDAYPAPMHIPGIATPGGSRTGAKYLRSIDEIPDRYRSIFPFPYFNFVQSEVLDDILYTDKPLVVAAPTGSGKTVIFELAILRLLIAQGECTRTKIVYMAPIKVLCSQRCEEWTEKFEPLGLKCQELTGDTDIEDFYQLQSVNIIFTTPEKWDSMTRRWRDNHSLVQMVKLFLVDEVHSLNEETRGATVEAVISRMKTVQAAQPDPHQTNSSDQGREARGTGLRFVAVSATIPNIKDIAEWLGSGNQTAVYHSFDDSYRPVKLRKVVIGYPCSENFSEFKFDLSLNYKLSGVIQTYSDNKPTLVFCATRKGVEQAAAILVKEARFVMRAASRQKLQMNNNRIRDSKLRDLVMNGVGYHHAGLDLQDRKAIEEMFLQGDLPALMATSTLAMGVNLPAHLVIVKSTQYYRCGSYTEYSETQVLQMIGRAGRPQFDSSATAVIMTKTKTKGKYENLLNGSEEIESSLHNHLIEHLNAEIVLRTITSMGIALDWLKSTFLYIRIQKNPVHYGLPRGLTQAQLDKRLEVLCTKDLTSLASISLIEMDNETNQLKPLETGRLMARYCVAFETMKQFTKLEGSETVSDLMVLLSKCKEFSDVQLRINERKALNKMNKDKNHVTIRYPMNGKIKTSDMKVNCLIQATLGSIPIQEFGLNQDCFKIFRAGQRLTRCLMEYLMTRTDFKSLLSSVLTAKCIQAKLWENSKHVARQLDKIGPTMANALVNAGMVSFKHLQQKNPREIELIVNRHPPFGNQITEAVTHLPKYDVAIEQIAKYSPMRAELNVTVSLQNYQQLAEKQTTKPNHMCVLIIGDDDNKVVFKQRIMDSQLLQSGFWMRKVEVKRALKGEALSINLISQDYVGLDVQTTHSPFYSGPKKPRGLIAETAPPPWPPTKRPAPSLPGRGNRTPPEWDWSSHPSASSGEELEEFGFRKPCNHRCLDKDTCAHDCCKLGVPVKGTPRSKPQPAKRKGEPGFLAEKGASAAATPSRPKVLRGIEGFLDQLHRRSQDINVTPSIKRLKFGDCDITPAPLPKLDKFAFTPRSTPKVPSQGTPTHAPLPTGTSPPPGANPPQGKPGPKALRATGWEQLDFYHQQRQLQVAETGHDGGLSRRFPDDDEELPKVSLGFDEKNDDLPCFELGYSDDDIICIDDSIKSNNCSTKTKEFQLDNQFSNLSDKFSDLPDKFNDLPYQFNDLHDPFNEHSGHDLTLSDQFVPPIHIPAGKRLGRSMGEASRSFASSSATLSQPVLEFSSADGYEQFVPPQTEKDRLKSMYWNELDAPAGRQITRTWSDANKSATLYSGTDDGNSKKTMRHDELDSAGRQLARSWGDSSASLASSNPTLYSGPTGNEQFVPPPNKREKGRFKTMYRDDSYAPAPPRYPRKHLGMRSDQFVPSGPYSRRDQPPMQKKPGGPLPNQSAPFKRCGASTGSQQPLPRPRLSTTWTKPLGQCRDGDSYPGASAKPGPKLNAPSRSPLQPLYGRTAKNLPDAFSTPIVTPPMGQTSPDEQALASCLDSVERSYMQKKQEVSSKPIPRLPVRSFFVDSSPKADDFGMDSIDTIFKGLF